MRTTFKKRLSRMTNFKMTTVRFYTLVAQLEESLNTNQEVGGSTPSGRTNRDRATFGAPKKLWRNGRVVYGCTLLTCRVAKALRGFESHFLRQRLRVAVSGQWWPSSFVFRKTDRSMTGLRMPSGTRRSRGGFEPRTWTQVKKEDQQSSHLSSFGTTASKHRVMPAK